MRTLVALMAFVGLMAATVGSASAVSVTASATLTGSAVNVNKVAPPGSGGPGTLKVTVMGNFPSNPAIFVGLDSFGIGTVVAADAVAPGKLEKIFNINAATLSTILANGFATFKFNSTSASVGSPYSVSAVLNYAPEPTSMAIFGLGALGAVALRRRKTLLA